MSIPSGYGKAKWVMMLGMLVVACVALIIWGIIVGRRKQQIEYDRIHRAIYDASQQSLQEAIEILWVVGIAYFNGKFVLPKYFWEMPYPETRAQVLLTLFRAEKKNRLTGFGVCERGLADLLVQRAKENPGQSLAIVCYLIQRDKELAEKLIGQFSVRSSMAQRGVTYMP